MIEEILTLRGVEDPCPGCYGLGCCAYPNTATWLKGVGGQTITIDVCDKCWGTGDKNRTGADLRKLRDEMNALKAEIKTLKKRLKQPRATDPLSNCFCDHNVRLSEFCAACDETE
jgi:hypothetical protein